MLNLNFSPFPIITTDRLHLRQIRESDVNEIFFLRSDPRVMQFIDRPSAQSIEDAAAFIEKMKTHHNNNEAIMWCITLKEIDKVIGTLGLWNFKAEHHRGEIGYVLHPEHHRKSIMNEAIRPVLDYGFKHINLHSVEANVNPANTGSIKLLEKNGFKKEGYFRENFYFNGKYLDTAFYSILNPLHQL